MMGFALLVDSGLDLGNEEACALAAETLQLEHEAYMLRHQGKGKGHSGFSQQRQFDISGSVSFQERKARLAQLKSRTECRRRGQKGHWHGDAACPKGGGKRSTSPGKKGFSPSSKSSSTSGAGGKNGKSTKPRVVYFSMVDEPGPGSNYERKSFMALHTEVPPPASLDGATTSGTRPMTMQSSTASGLAPTSMQSCTASGLAPISMLSSISLPPQASLAAASVPEPTEEDLRRIQELNEVIRQANNTADQRHGEGEGREAQELPIAVRPEDRLYANVFGLLHQMEVDEEDGNDVKLNPHGVYGSRERQDYLDFVLSVLDPSHPEYAMTYSERWNEFVPGHPMFLEEDRQRIDNYKNRCELGLPVLPFRCE